MCNQDLRRETSTTLLLLLHKRISLLLAFRLGWRGSHPPPQPLFSHWLLFLRQGVQQIEDLVIPAALVLAFWQDLTQC